MDSRTVALIRTTFKAVAAEEEGPERLARAFYAILFTNYPPVRDLFPAAMDLQRDRLVNAISYTLDQLEDPDELVPFLSQLGRDHRKYGVRGEHYVAVASSFKSAVRQFAGTEMWTDEVDRAWDEGLTLISDTMLGAAEQEASPAVWVGRVVENRPVLRNLSVIKLRLDQPMEYVAGQYMSVQIPSRPRMWRYLSPAVPSNPQGEIEFHVRGIMGGWVSPAIISQTQIGDQWLIGSPLGGLGARNAKRKMLMVGCGTGIAPLRAQLLEMAQRRSNPKVHLFVGGHHPCDLYDLEILGALAREHAWLTVTPVAENEEEPWWFYRAPGELEPHIPGLQPRVVGQLGKIVAESGPWTDHDIQIAGSPSMVQTTRFRLMSTGVPAKDIRHDPLF